MEPIIDKINSCSQRMRFSLGGAEVDREVSNRIQNYARQASIPGFRKGKVPVRLIQSRYGEALLGEIILDLSNARINSIVREKEIRMVGSPMIENYGRNEETQQYDVSIVYEVLPVLEVLDIKDCTVVRPKVNVTEEDLDAEIELWLQRFPRWELVDRPAQSGDRVLVYGDRIHHVHEVSDIKKYFSIHLETASCEASLMNACIGLKAGDKLAHVVYDTEDESDESADEEQGIVPVKLVTVEADIQSVEQPVPDSLSEEMLQTLDVESLQDENFREKAMAFLNEKCIEAIQGDLERQVFGWLGARNEFDMPTFAINEYLRRNLMREGLNAEQADDFIANKLHTVEGLSIYLETSKQVKMSYMFDQLSEHYGIRIDREKIKEKVQEELENAKANEPESSAQESVDWDSYQSLLYSKHLQTAERETRSGLTEKLLEDANCEDIELTYEEYVDWQNSITELPAFATPDESQDDDIETESEKSVILDATGNPIEREST